jgi:hypothetical protein
MDLKGIKEDGVNRIHLYGTKGSHGGEFWNYSVLICERAYYDT